MEEDKHHRSGAVSGPHTYAGGNSAEDERVGICGISQRKKQLDDPRAPWESEVQTRESDILVPWILRGHDWEKHQANRGVHPKPAEGRSGVGSDQAQRVRRPVYGWQVTIPSQAADRKKRLEAPLVKKGYARIRKSTGCAGRFLLFYKKFACILRLVVL